MKFIIDIGYNNLFNSRNTSDSNSYLTFNFSPSVTINIYN